MRAKQYNPSPLDYMFDFAESFKSAKKPLEGPAYQCQYVGREIIHAVQPKRRMIGYIIADMSYGGGLRVLCGLPAEGKVILSKYPVPPDQISCRNCLRVLLAQAKRLIP